MNKAIFIAVASGIVFFGLMLFMVVSERVERENYEKACSFAGGNSYVMNGGGLLCIDKNAIIQVNP